MFNDVKLQVNYECEMAFELLRLVKKQLKEGYYELLGLKDFLSDLRVTAAQVYVTAAKLKHFKVLEEKSNEIIKKGLNGWGWMSAGVSYEERRCIGVIEMRIWVMACVMVSPSSFLSPSIVSQGRIMIVSILLEGLEEDAWVEAMEVKIG
ncbi:hypothetical protein Tco_0557292 [Tanacetum coccineum]